MSCANSSPRLQESVTQVERNLQPVRQDFDLEENNESGEDSSCSSCSEAENREWLENVNRRGNVMHIEADYDVENHVAYDRYEHKSIGCQIPKPISAINRSYIVENESLEKFDSLDLHIKVQDQRRNLGRRATLLESMLGLIAKTNNDGLQDSLIVQGFIPDADLTRHDGLNIGDLIHCVNCIEVNNLNINQVLEPFRRSQQIKLTICRKKPFSRQSLTASKATARGSIKVLNSNINSNQQQDNGLHKLYHCVMFLTPPFSSMSESSQNEVKYAYPEKENIFLSIRGLFYAQCNIIPDVTTSFPSSSSMIHENELIHACYVVEDRNLMVVAAPDTCLNLMELQNLCSDLTQFLRLQHTTLTKAFIDPENKPELNDLFSEIFASLRSQKSMQDSFRMSKTLPIPDDIQLPISDALNDLEAADFSDFIDIGPKRSYSIVGCCFHYNGFLLCNHLSPQYLEDINLLLRYFFLLKITSDQAASINQLVFWREIFPSVQNTDHTVDDLLGHNITSPRYYLLTVGLKRCLLSTVLETRGFTPRQEGCYPGPNPIYVDKAKDTLELILESSNGNFSQQIDHIIDRQSSCIQLADPQSFVSKNKSGQPSKASELFNESSNRKRSLSDLRPFSKKGSTEYDASSGRSRDTFDDSTPILGRSQHRESSKFSFDFLSRSSSADNLLTDSKKKDKKSIFDLTSLRHETQLIDQAPPAAKSTSLLNGCENGLFQYLSVDGGEGVIIHPTDELVLHKNELKVEIMENFRRCCSILHNTFQNSYKNKDNRRQIERSIFSSDNSINHVNEQGLLFHCQIASDKNQSNGLTYWVVGRQFMHPYPREVYICYHESAQPNIIEMGFKLAISSSL